MEENDDGNKEKVRTREKVGDGRGSEVLREDGRWVWWWGSV